MKQYLVIVVLLVIIDIMTLQNIPITTYITADAKTGWGNWGVEQNCPNRSLAVGYYLRVEDPCGSCDDTALNGIVLLCQDGSIVTSTYGPWGAFKSAQICPYRSYLTGFTFRSEPSQGKGDDTAGNDLHMRCSDGTILSNSGGAPFGSFGNWISCTFGHICGIRTLVEQSQGSGDDTALNSVTFTCCLN